MSPNNLNKRSLFEMKHQNKYAQLVEAQSPEPEEQAAAGDSVESASSSATSPVAALAPATISKDLAAAAAEDDKDVESKQSAEISPHSDSLKQQSKDFQRGEGSEERARAPESMLDLQEFQVSAQADLVVASNQASASDATAACSSAAIGVPERKPSQCDSSQMSTSFVSTADESGTSAGDQREKNLALDELQRASDANGLFSQRIRRQQPPSAAEEEKKKLDSPSSSSSSSSRSASISFSSANRTSINFGADEISPKRSISRSMLKLDQSVRLDNFQVKWSNLSFSYQPSALTSLIKRNSPVKSVLRNISGSFKSNQLIAIIGPSGCGKTTLLQFLAGDTPSSRQELSIFGLDEPKVAFIGQDDCLLPGLTPRETLIYASRLQNSKDKQFNHEEHIKPILKELGLSECADRNVTKLSGGQAKRVTIAQELLYPKNLLFLDEVTSGLDVSTSYSIVKLLKRLVSNQEYPMSIVMSIHQPSAKLFSIFDQVYVMSEGCCLYEGSCEVNQVNAYLKGFGLECPKFHNIADYLIEIASDDLTSARGDSHNNCSEQLPVRERMIQMQRKRHQLAATSFNINNSGAGQAGLNGAASVQTDAIALKTMINPSSTPTPYESPSAITRGGDSVAFCKLVRDVDCEKSQQVPLVISNTIDADEPSSALIIVDGLYSAIERSRRRRERPFWGHLCVHFNRSTLRIRRSYILTYLQLIAYIALGLQLATFYGPSIGSVSGCPSLPLSFMNFLLSNEQTNEDQESEVMRRIQENMNFLLVTTMTATFAALEITVITFPMEAKTVKREWRNGWYRVTSYFMGRTLADLPFQLTFVVLFCLVVYSLTGQIGLATWRFGSFVLIIIMVALVAQTVGFIFGAAFMNNLPAAVFMAPLCIFPALLFSGFFSRVSQIPPFYRPMTYLSHFRYAFDALLVTLYGYDRCQCDQAALSNYHANSINQTDTIKDMFKTLFGADCVASGTGGGVTGSPDENSIEDSTSAMVLNRITTTALPKLLASKTIDKSIEDALVDSVFEHMNKTTNAETTTEAAASGAMEHLLNKFSAKTTTILSTKSNFGHPMPVQCDKFNSYLITEFDLHNEDLMFGLMMLFIFVIMSRILCNIILNFTIATRTTNY